MKINGLNITDEQYKIKGLKKCPFCGGDAVLRIQTAYGFGLKTDDLLIYCQCEKCRVKTGGAMTGKAENRDKPITKKDAIQYAVTKWNKRAPRA